MTTTIGALPVARHLTSIGDADLWLAPRTSEPGAVTVLRFTTIHGIGLAIALTRDELTRLRAQADNILEATPDTIKEWLDQAARTLYQAT